MSTESEPINDMTNSIRITGRPTAVRYRMSEQDGELATHVPHAVDYIEDGTALVATPTGPRVAESGDWIVRDAHGDLFVLVDKHGAP